MLESVIDKVAGLKVITIQGRPPVITFHKD